MSIRNYISKDKIENIAIEKYRQNGLGITFEDIEKECSVNKTKAQRKLKHFHSRKCFLQQTTLTQGITAIQNKSPQQYFPTCIKAEIIEGLSKQQSLYLTKSDLSCMSSCFMQFWFSS